MHQPLHRCNPEKACALNNGLSCFAVRREVWVENADRWGQRYEGDFDFIHGLWERDYEFHWWPRLAFRALRISYGAPEEVTG